MEGLIKEKYKIIKEIGNGSFGKVFLVENVQNNEFYALKRLKREEIIKSNYLYSAYWKELEVMKECECENSVRLIENFVTNQNLNIVMELCDEDLEKWIDKYKGNVSENIIKSILIELNNTFKLMSEKNIVHRDLKLKNIMIKYNKNKEFYDNNLNFKPKLIDFGFSKILDESDITKTMLGTPATMAPEIIRHLPYTCKCDIWSLGIIIYQMLFKQHPFRGRNENEILKVILSCQGNFKIPDNLSISDTLNDLLRKMLIIDPNKRISWEEYLSHDFFLQESDKEMEKFEKTYSSARKLSDVNNGFYNLNKAKNKQTGEYVYIKEYDKEYINSDSNIKRQFEIEVELTKVLSGKSDIFMKYIDFYDTKKTYILIVEYFDGRLLDNFLKNKKSISIETINEIIRQLSISFQIINEVYPFDTLTKMRIITSKSLWMKTYQDDQNFILKIFDYGIGTFYSDQKYNSLYTLNIPFPIENTSSSQSKVLILSFGLLLYRILFDEYLFQPKPNDDIYKLTKEKAERGEKIKITKQIPKLLKSLLEKCIHLNIEKRYSLNDFLKDEYIKSIVNKEKGKGSEEGRIKEKVFFISDFKIENIIESIIFKSNHIITYYSNLLGIDFSSTPFKKKEISKESIENNNYYDQYIKQICIFNTLLNLEVNLCIELIKNSYEDDLELHILRINQNEGFDYSFLNFHQKKVKINYENVKLEDYLVSLKGITEKVFFITKEYFKKINISLNDIDTFSYLEQSLKSSYLISLNKYFFAIFERGVKFYEASDREKAYNELLLSKYFFENILFIRMVTHLQDETINFEKLFETIEEDNYLDIISSHKKSNVLTDINSIVIVSFLGGIYKDFKEKKIIENRLITESTIDISDQSFSKTINFYPQIIKIASQCK